MSDISDPAFCPAAVWTDALIVELALKTELDWGAEPPQAARTSAAAIAGNAIFLILTI